MKMKSVIKSKAGIDFQFGSIFSTILIITFIVFGFYAITKFLDLQKTIQIESFMRDLQGDVDDMWKSTQGSRAVEYSLPNTIVSVCFKEDEFENMQFTSEKIIRGTNIEHIDIEKTIGSSDSLCAPNFEGKVKMILVKNFGEVLVTITK